MISFVNRFHGHNSLSYVYKNGTAVRSHLMVIKMVNNPHRKHSRMAVVISKKVLKSAVSRNRVRRVIYEYLRAKLPHIKTAHDIVVIVSSSEILTMPHQDVAEQLNQLFSQSLIK